MAYKLEWSLQSIEDIEAIASYIEKDSAIYAKSVVSKIYDKSNMLTDFPKMGRIVPELNSENIREIFVYSYRVIYKVKDKTILIIAVVHGKMLLDNYKNTTPTKS